MRPLPIALIADAPSGVAGWSLIRGSQTLVLDAATLAGIAPLPAARFVTLKHGDLRVGLAVDAVDGVVDIAIDELDAATPMFDESRVDAIVVTGLVDAAFTPVLRAAMRAPDRVIVHAGRRSA